MYTPTRWQDHVTSPSNCFTITDRGDGTYIITPAGEVMQQGTPQDQLHFNNIENGIFDSQLAISLLLNLARQQVWEVERGSVTLTNNKAFPFNGSQQTVALSAGKENGDYIVLTEVASFSGNVGEIVVSDKLCNGFKIAFTGSATSAVINYIVIGGILR